VNEKAKPVEPKRARSRHYIEFSLRWHVVAEKRTRVLTCELDRTLAKS
jgi:hypothetical protein